MTAFPGRLRLEMLGSGASFGVPVIGCRCPACTSSDPHDQRARSSIRLQWEDTQVERTGECMRDLLNTLLYNLQHPSRPRYARFVVNTNLDPKYLPILTRDIAQYSESLADSLEHSLNDPNKVLSPRSAPQEAHRIGVGIFLVHDQMEIPAVKPAPASAHRKKGRRKP